MIKYSTFDTTTINNNNACIQLCPTLCDPKDCSPPESEIRGTLRFLPQLEMRPSYNAPNPVESREAPPTSSFPDFSEPP